MGMLYGHYDGTVSKTNRVIAKLQKFDEFFRTTKPSEFGRQPLLGQLPAMRKELELALEGDYRITVRDAARLNDVYILSGKRAKVDWAMSMSRGHLVLTGLIPVDPSTLFIARKTNHADAH